MKRYFFSIAGCFLICVMTLVCSGIHIYFAVTWMRTFQIESKVVLEMLFEQNLHNVYSGAEVVLLRKMFVSFFWGAVAYVFVAVYAIRFAKNKKKDGAGAGQGGSEYQSQRK